MVSGRRRLHIVFSLIKFCVHLVVVIVLPFFSYSQQEISYSDLTIQHGLPQRSVLSQHQDRFGFVWIGTRDGLCRYDGYAFVTYRHDLNNPESISGNIIQSISEDQSGNIWVITENGLSKFSVDQNRFLNYNLSQEIYGSSGFHELYISKSGQIWVGCRQGLFQFDQYSGQFYKHSFYENGVEKLSHGIVSAITEDAHGNIIVGASRFALFSYNPLTRKGKTITTDHQQSQFLSRIEDIVVEGDRYWLGTYGSGLFLLDHDGLILERWHQGAADDDQKIANNIRVLKSDMSGRLWIGAFPGLYEIVERSDLQFSVRHSEQNKSIRSILLDRQENVWVGTYDEGVRRYTKSDQRFEHFKTEQYSLEKISSIHYEANSGFLIGTENGELFQIDKTGIVQSVKSGLNVGIKSIYKQNDDQLWLGGFGKGLYKKTLSDGTLTWYPLSEQRNPNFNKRVIINKIVGVDDGLWVVTDGFGGLHYFDHSTNDFVSYPNDERLKDIIGHKKVKDIQFLTDSELLLATHGLGLVCYNVETGDFKVMNELETSSSRIKIENINHILLQNKERIWLSTNGQGVLDYDVRKKISSIHLHTKNGLLDNSIYGAVPLADGEVVFISMHGLSKLTRQHNVETIDYKGGFPLRELNESAFAFDGDSKIVVGGYDGLVGVNMYHAAPKNKNLPIQFTQLQIGNVLIFPQDSTSILSQNINNTDRIRLDHTRRNFSIDFSAFPFHSLAAVTYEYSISEEEDDWILTTNNQVSFSNLKPGKYQFRVRPVNAGVADSSAEKSLEIDILPPFWWSGTAKVIYALMLVVLVYLMWRRRIQEIRLQHKLKLEQIETEKWKEIHDTKLSFFMDVSHEFRTPLSLILAPLEELIEGEKMLDWKKNRLNIIHFNAKRLRLLIDQILQIHEIESGAYKVVKQPVYLAAHIQEMMRSFLPLAEKNGIRLRCQVDQLGDGTYEIDRDKIEKVLYNIIQNAFKFTPKYEEIGLEATWTAGMLHIKMWDTGQGIAPADVPHIFGRFYTKGGTENGVGIGLSLAKSLAELMNGTLEFVEREEKGACFELMIPNVDRGKIIEEVMRSDFQEHIYPIFNPELVHKNLGTDKSEDRVLQTILLVDDNEEILQYLKSQIETDYKVLLATNSTKGLEMVNKYVPDLIVSDVVMPEIDGLQFCKIIKDNINTCHIPVILLTAKHSQANVLEGLSSGADDYLVKPFHVLELKMRIHNILKAIQMLHQHYQTNFELPKLDQLVVHDKDEKFLEKLNDLIHSNIENPNVNVEWLGDQAGMSRVHLFRKLKALTGLTPSDYIKNYRIKYSCQLLVKKNAKVSEVAIKVGIHDSAYFSKVFKKETGKTPSEYIQSYKL